VQKWDTFKKSTYPVLVETVKHFNAFTVPGLATNEAISKEIQLHVRESTKSPWMAALIMWDNR
jgi:hypothetical protein